MAFWSQRRSSKFDANQPGSFFLGQAQVVQTCTLAMKYIIRGLSGIDNVSHFTKTDDNGHLGCDTKRATVSSCSEALPQIVFQSPAAAWMSQFTQRLRLNLTYALARHIEVPADFFKRMIFAIHQTEA